MTIDYTAWLVQEVSDLLDAGRVGLYEFIWILRSEYPELSSSDQTRIAQDALKRLQENEIGHLVWMKWSELTSDERADVAEPSAKYWQDPVGDAPYLALINPLT